MTSNAEGGKSIIGGIRDDFKALSTKQLIAVILAVAVSLIVMTVLLPVLGSIGMSVCLGLLLVVIILYMVPHLMGIWSGKVKSIAFVIFAVLAILIGTFGYGSSMDDSYETVDNEVATGVTITYSETDGTYAMTFSVSPTGAGIGTTEAGALESWRVFVAYGPTSMIAYGLISASDYTEVYLASDQFTATSGGWYQTTMTFDNMAEGNFNVIYVYVQGTNDEGNWESITGVGMTYDSGISSGDVYAQMFYGAIYLVVICAIMFFVILGFSTLMRRSATKTRQKMESEGRLYPQGYGRCKDCGAMVLPGEVVCRKCGAYIDVPEEMRPKKKDFVTCSECGAEVPADADACPRCGARFDEAEEVEVEHVDGSVETTTDSIACPHCGGSIPANAGWCPKCGKKVKE